MKDAFSRRFFWNIPKSLTLKKSIVVRHAKGATITAMNGKEYIDFAGGIGAANVGHSNPAVVAAVIAQTQQFMHVGQTVIGYEPYVVLAEKINSIAPIRTKTKTMFWNSGAEAVENAVKIARYATKRKGIICLDNAFSGRTLLTMTLTSKVKPYKWGFGPFAPQVYRVHSPYLYRRPKAQSENEYIDWCIAQFDALLKKKGAKKIAAVVLELVQGEGGFIVLPQEYVRKIAALCKKSGILLIVDEIQTGFGRTGTMFATEQYGIDPDLVTLAKSLGGGLPLSAVVGRAELMDCVHEGGLGGTFGGNPVCCAAGLAAIQEIERLRLVQRSQSIGRKVRSYFLKLRDEIPQVGDVRGLGAMQAIEFVTDKKSRKPVEELTKRIRNACAEDGLLILSSGTSGNVLRTLMPLSISDHELEKGLAILENAIRRCI